MDMILAALVPSFNNRAVIWFKRGKVMVGAAGTPAASGQRRDHGPRTCAGSRQPGPVERKAGK